MKIADQDSIIQWLKKSCQFQSIFEILQLNIAEYPWDFKWNHQHSYILLQKLHHMILHMMERELAHLYIDTMHILPNRSWNPSTVIVYFKVRYSPSMSTDNITLSVVCGKKVMCFYTQASTIPKPCMWNAFQLKIEYIGLLWWEEKSFVLLRKYVLRWHPQYYLMVHPL